MALFRSTLSYPNGIHVVDTNLLSVKFFYFVLDTNLLSAHYVPGTEPDSGDREVQGK